MHFSTLCGNFDSTWAKDFSHMQFSRHNVRILHYSKQLKFCIKYHFWWHPRTYGSNNMLFLHSCSKEWRRAEAQSSLFHGPMRRWKCLFSPWHLSNRRSTAPQNGLQHTHSKIWKKDPNQVCGADAGADPPIWLPSAAQVVCRAGATAPRPAHGQERSSTARTWEPARRASRALLQLWAHLYPQQFCCKGYSYRSFGWLGLLKR